MLKHPSAINGRNVSASHQNQSRNRTCCTRTRRCALSRNQSNTPSGNESVRTLSLRVQSENETSPNLYNNICLVPLHFGRSTTIAIHHKRHQATTAMHVPAVDAVFAALPSGMDDLTLSCAEPSLSERNDACENTAVVVSFQLLLMCVRPCKPRVLR